MLDRIWHSGKLNTLWAVGAALLYALWDVWGTGGFQIPKDKGAAVALAVAALRLVWAKDHPGVSDTGSVSGSWKPKPGTTGEGSSE